MLNKHLEIAMFRITLGEYTIALSDNYPALYSEYHKHAKLADVLDGSDAEGSLFYVSLAKGADWPFLLVVQKYSPGPKSGFYPGVLLVPETRHVFIGAGKRLLVYSWDPPQKVPTETISVGFLGWERHGQFVIMSSELELAVWNISGEKLWSTFVEPPWDYTIENDRLHLNVMGKKSSFSLGEGTL
jgi:hypothetical protein